MPAMPAASLLSRRARKILLSGRLAQKGGRTSAQRARNIALIASAYTREELAQEIGIGPVMLVEIETWLTTGGLRFRKSTEF